MAGFEPSSSGVGSCHYANHNHIKKNSTKISYERVISTHPEMTTTSPVVVLLYTSLYVN